MFTVNKVSDFPKLPHYVIMTFEHKNIYHEGDERSRTNPGHGYPAYTESYTESTYQYFN